MTNQQNNPDNGNPQPQGYPQRPPHHSQGAPTPYGHPGRNAAPYARPREKPVSTKAIVSLVMGIASLFLMPLGVIFGLVGIVLGWLGMRETAEPDGTHRGRGLAVGGLITSIAVWVINALFVGFLVFVVFNAIEQTENARHEYRQERTSEDLRLIGERLELYYTENARSLAPGGPVVKDGWGGGLLPENTPRVEGELRVEHLVREYDLNGYMSDYELSVRGESSAVIYCRPNGLKLEIANIDRGPGKVEEIPGDR